MSRRRDYAAAEGTIVLAWVCAVVFGPIMLLSLVVDQFPVADAEVRLWIGLAGAFFFAGGIWIIRSPPPSSLTQRLAGALLGVGYLVGGPVALWLLQLELPHGFEVFIYGFLVLITIGGWKVLRATWRLSTDLKDALEVPPTSAELAAEIAEDRMSALVEEIRGATMKTDPAHIRFTSTNNFQERKWEGRLRDEDAVLTWTGMSLDRSFRRSGSLILSKDEFRIVSRRVWFRRSSRRAKVFVGDQRFDGWIPNEAVDRYERWKANLAVGR